MTNKPRFSGEKSGTALKDSCVLIMGQSPSSNSYNTSGDGLPFYQGNADFGEENPVPRSWCTEPKKIAEKGDILISVRAPIGAINIADEKCCIGRGVAAIRPNQEVMSPDFLQHQLFASRNKLEAMGTGSTFKAIGKKTLSDFPVVIYPKNTQEAIAQQLNSIKKQIKTANSQLDQLDTLVKSRFVEMFEGCQSFKPIESIARTFNGDRGKNYPSAKDRVGEGVPFINAGHMEHGRVVFEEMDYITESKYDQLSNGKVTHGDILFCLRGSLGKCALVDFERGALASSLMAIRPNVEIVLPEYLLQVMGSPRVQQQMKATENGSSQPNLSAKSVKGFIVPVPPLEKQKEFLAFVQQVDKLKYGRPSDIRPIGVKCMVKLD